MPYYSKRDYRLLGFKKSTNKSKMYCALIQNKKNNKIIKLHFGHDRMMNYKDDTKLNSYPHLIHNDPKRRLRYRARAKGKVKDDYYSSSYFSYHILW